MAGTSSGVATPAAGLGAQQYDEQDDQRHRAGRRGEYADQAQGLWPFSDRDPDRGTDFFSQAHVHDLLGRSWLLIGAHVGATAPAWQRLCTSA
jgi:hypothetical protein